MMIQECRRKYEMSRGVNDNRRCERVVTEIARNMTTLVNGGETTNERILSVTDSVREMDPSLWNDIEGNIQAMEEEAVNQRQLAPQTLPASAYISHPSVDGGDTVPSQEVENANSLVGNVDDNDDGDNDDGDVDVVGDVDDNDDGDNDDGNVNVVGDVNDGDDNFVGAAEWR